MDLKKKSINKFAILIILMILVPEIIGHAYFETQKHPKNSSVVAAISLTSKMHSIQLTKNISCQLVIQNDTSASHVTRANGLTGQFGNYTCK
ncbi:MAG: hypothetical protein HY222_03200 [Thaumarchaeota archaeon]|nr:hypothetical protein [Nitrososphaerota archaeon]